MASHSYPTEALESPNDLFARVPRSSVNADSSAFNNLVARIVELEEVIPSDAIINEGDEGYSFVTGIPELLPNLQADAPDLHAALVAAASEMNPQQPEEPGGAEAAEASDAGDGAELPRPSETSGAGGAGNAVKRSEAGQPGDSATTSSPPH